MDNEVLVLDDDQDVLDAVAEFVELLSTRNVHKVRSLAELVSLGESALACSLAILDINLGAGSPTGVDAARWLREHKFSGRIVFFSGHARGYPMIEEALQIANVEILAKPMSIDQLRALLDGKSS